MMDLEHEVASETARAIAGRRANEVRARLVINARLARDSLFDPGRIILSLRPW